MKRPLIAMAAAMPLAFASASAMGQFEVVAFQSDLDGHLVAGLAEIGVTPTRLIEGDFAELYFALLDSSTTHVFISNSCCDFDPLIIAEIANFVSRGEGLHLSYWNLSAEPALQGTLGITSAIDFTLPRSVHDNTDHASWRFTDTPVLPADDAWDRNGSEITAAADGSIVGTFDTITGAGAIVVANDRRTLCNSFDYDSMEADGIRQLIGAQAEFILGFGPPCYPDFDRDGQLTIFDFLGFQSDFTTGRRKADCDGDRELTIFDFFCFQNFFDQGCP